MGDPGIVETTTLENVLDGHDLISARDTIAHAKCPICGASPRTGVAFYDEEYDSATVYACCGRCEHAERL